LNIRPLGDRIIVKNFEEEAKTACGIYIVERQLKKTSAGRSSFSQKKAR
jgi:co-chaperonin GroES (HSP10)